MVVADFSEPSNYVPKSMACAPKCLSSLGNKGSEVIKLDTEQMKKKEMHER
jgi:hypothetical protein